MDPHPVITVKRYLREHWDEIRVGISDKHSRLRPHAPEPGLLRWFWRRIRYLSALDPKPRGFLSEELEDWARELDLPTSTEQAGTAALPYLFAMSDAAKRMARELHLDPEACNRYWGRKLMESDGTEPLRPTDYDPQEGLDDLLDGV